MFFCCFDDSTLRAVTTKTTYNFLFLWFSCFFGSIGIHCFVVVSWFYCLFALCAVCVFRMHDVSSLFISSSFPRWASSAAFCFIFMIVLFCLLNTPLDFHAQHILYTLSYVCLYHHSSLKQWALATVFSYPYCLFHVHIAHVSMCFFFRFSGHFLLFLQHFHSPRWMVWLFSGGNCHF